jgi:uncharacterized protein YdeI (YjbR/CyaY-like superfamily)
VDDIDGEPVLEFPSRADLESWLAAADDSPDGGPAVWLLLARKGSPHTSITSDEAVDIGLCFGWISAVRRSHDDGSYLQRYTRRRPASRWSRVNIAKVARLTAEGRMRPGGQREVEAARADGRWDSPST